MTLALLLLLKAAVAIIIFAIGMDSTPRDATRLLQHPGLLLRSLLAMYVLVPLAAFALVKTLTLAPGVEIGLLVLAVSAGAPLLPRKLMGIGDGGYTFSLVVISSVLAIVIVPAWLALLGPQFGAPPALEPATVAWVLAKSFFLPLAAGMLVRWWFPAFAARVASRAIGIAGIVLMLGAVILLALQWEIVLHIKWAGVLTLAALIVHGPGDRPRVRRSDRGRSYGARHRLRDPPHRRRRHGCGLPAGAADRRHPRGLHHDVAGDLAALSALAPRHGGAGTDP